MKRMLILALAASLLPCTSFAQVPMLTTPAPLKANSGDQNIKLSTARPPFKKGAVIKLCPVTTVTPASSYVAKAATCPTPIITPPVVTPPPPAPADHPFTLIGEEAAVRIGNTVFGFNAYGALGTAADVPAAFRTPGDKYARKGFFINGVDVVVPGAPIDAHAYAYTLNGKRIVIANNVFNLSGNGAKGTWTTAGVWTARLGVLEIVRAFTSSATGLRVVQTITPLEAVGDLRMLLSQDPDNGDSGAAGVTTNRIVGEAAVTAALASGKVYSLATDDERFAATVAPNVIGKSYSFMSPDTVPTRAVGYSGKADENLFLDGRFGDRAAGQPVTTVYEMGVR